MHDSSVRCTYQTSYGSSYKSLSYEKQDEIVGNLNSYLRSHPPVCPSFCSHLSSRIVMPSRSSIWRYRFESSNSKVADLDNLEHDTESQISAVLSSASPSKHDPFFNNQARKKWFLKRRASLWSLWNCRSINEFLNFEHQNFVKSILFADQKFTSYSSMRRFAALRSRWMIPLLCKKSYSKS